MVCRKEELQREEIIAVKCSSYRGGRKSKLSYRHAELGAVKVKKLEMFRPAHCSLYLLCSQGRERKKLIPLFHFHCNVMENSIEVPWKIKNSTTVWSSNSTPGYLSNKNENTNLKRCMNLFICVYVYICVYYGISWWLGGKESTCQYRRREFNLWSRKIPWRWKWPPTPVFLPWKIAWTESSLAGYSTQGHKRVRHNLATK